MSNEDDELWRGRFAWARGISLARDVSRVEIQCETCPAHLLTLRRQGHISDHVGTRWNRWGGIEVSPTQRVRDWQIFAPATGDLDATYSWACRRCSHRYSLRHDSLLRFWPWTGVAETDVRSAPPGGRVVRVKLGQREWTPVHNLMRG